MLLSPVEIYTLLVASTTNKGTDKLKYYNILPFEVTP